jgi:hypothetical protein
MLESPFAIPDPKLRIKQFSHLVPRPTPEQVANIPTDATALLDRIWTRHNELIPYGQFNLDWMRGKHFLLAGATGPGLGGSIESAARRFTVVDGSVTVLARDLSKSVGYEMGIQMVQRAEKAGFGERYHLINKGMDIKGATLEMIINSLQEAGAKEVIYINGVAAAFSGMLPGYPPVYVKDVDEEGLFQYELQPLTDQQIETTRYIWGLWLLSSHGLLRMPEFMSKPPAILIGAAVSMSSAAIRQVRFMVVRDPTPLVCICPRSSCRQIRFRLMEKIAR